jgi:hypothetical protein
LRRTRDAETQTYWLLFVPGTFFNRALLWGYLLVLGGLEKLAAGEAMMVSEN